MLDDSALRRKRPRGQIEFSYVRVVFVNISRENVTGNCSKNLGE